MEHLELGIVLLVVVVCVIAATRPVPKKRSGSDRQANRLQARPRVQGGHRTFISLNRNPWDRNDLSRAVSGEHADTVAAESWPLTIAR